MNSKVANNRNTIQKRLVIDAIHCLDHPTVEAIYEEILKKYQDISKATVYRNLKQLVESGDIGRVPVPNGADHFDMTAHKHYHAVCNQCGKIVDVEMNLVLLEELKRTMRETNEFKIEDQEIIFKGICKSCSDKIN